MRNVLITGAGGMLAREVIELGAATVRMEGLTRAQLDISDADALEDVCKALRPDVVINAAAYTAVDDAEDNEAEADRVNHAALVTLGECARRFGFRVIHFSTDYVFDGQSGQPYRTASATNPINVYGRTKRDGELALARSAPSYAIVRASWLYSRHESNFVKTILQALAEREEVEVVDDQVGRPTWARGLAEVAWCLSARQDLTGIFHWGDAGVASWYDLGNAVHEYAARFGMPCKTVYVKPTTSDAFPHRAKRPPNSVLDIRETAALLQLVPRNWRHQLMQMMEEMVSHGTRSS